MVIYEVTVELADQTLAVRFCEYMQERHLPQIFATGCFHSIQFEGASEVRFRTRYVAATEADLARYLEQHTAGFRRDFQEHFPEGCRVSREHFRPLKSFGV